jgi:spore coat polysaccharide biosynthesis protein SpsF
MIINVFLQVRNGSNRLPGKVLKKLSDKTMLQHHIERLKLAKLVDNIIVLTSIDESDDAINELCESNRIDCFRGDLDDVLSRYCQALKKYPCDHIVRMTGDCPLLDWDVVDYIIDEHVKAGVDYTSNTIIPSYPDGLDVEVIKRECLLDVNNKALKPYEREHVTYYIYSNKNLYLTKNILNPLGDESNLRWTVDEISDFKFIQVIYKELYKSYPFSVKKVRELLKNKPHLNEINKGIIRNEGLMSSLRKFK